LNFQNQSFTLKVPDKVGIDIVNEDL